MTEEDKQRKVAQQFARRVNAKQGGMIFKLGTKGYWEAYNRFFEQQQGCCAICKKPWIEGTRRMHLDHNHKTLELRGLLCFSCNYKLGWFEKFMGNILKYLGYKRVV